LPPRRSIAQSADRLRRESRERAESAALIVPWPRIQEAAVAYADWQVFALDVRSACEPSEEIPPAVAGELTARCPGFLEWEQHQRERKPASHSVWRCLVQWIAEHEFVAAKKEGWFEAVAYYGLERIESIQAWSKWTRDNLATSATMPALPQSLALASAVDGLLESRALLLWTTALTPRNARLHALASAELAGHLCRTPVEGLSPWNRSAFLRLAFDLDRQCTSQARSEGWFATLRHQFLHHPRYHRLVHFCFHCQSEWRGVTPRPAPTFARWKQACDVYCVPRVEPR
jgi:hypothetical protein